MKYILMIWMCSFLNEPNCSPPMTSEKIYDSWYECTQAAYAKSRQVIAKIGYSYVNEFEVATKFTCTRAGPPV